MSDLIRSMKPPSPQWTPGAEKAFQSWYGAWAKRTGLDPNPDAPEHRYDYRAAYLSGAQPDADMHWPSQFKADDHPNRYINGLDTKTGKRPERGDFLLKGLMR